ncbi:hypothetical protein [Vibrio campbellii]|uniref:hypothetical protein n=1 Tax=Vibrio campbellii TaxID=680 RepID=UPI00210E4E3A|nr:hypothetical protein [Vibrio campbellii]UTZ43700.1 hypothetical protein HB764_20735 [Vibrio campbellii]
MKVILPKQFAIFNNGEDELNIEPTKELLKKQISSESPSLYDCIFDKSGRALNFIFATSEAGDFVDLSTVNCCEHKEIKIYLAVAGG